MKFTEYNEKKQHGTSDFPIEYYYVNKDHPQYIMPPHWHTEFEIIYIVSGKFSLFLNNIPYEMSAGDFAVIESGMLHRGVPQNCIYKCLVFDINMLRSKKAVCVDAYISPCLNHISSIEKTYHNNSILTATVSALFSVTAGRQKYYELETMSLLFRFFSLLYREGYISKTAKTHYNVHQTKMITELLDWIDEHFSEQITLLDLAKVSGLKEKYLCRIFKEYTTKTPIDYINRLRIDNACRDFAHSGSTVTDVAFNNGFNDLSYFSKTFKKYKGISPKEYKNASTN